MFNVKQIKIIKSHVIPKFDFTDLIKIINEIRCVDAKSIKIKLRLNDVGVILSPSLDW